MESSRRNLRISRTSCCGTPSYRNILKRRSSSRDSRHGRQSRRRIRRRAQQESKMEQVLDAGANETPEEIAWASQTPGNYLRDNEADPSRGIYYPPGDLVEDVMQTNGLTR